MEMVQETILDPQRTGSGYKARLLAFRAFGRGMIKVVYVVEGDTAVVISTMWE